MTKFKEGRERLKADVEAWEKSAEEPVCVNDEDVDFTLVDQLKDAMAGTKGTLVHDPITDAWYTTTINSEDIMKPLSAAEIVEVPIDLQQYLEEPEKAFTGTKFEFVREYTGRKIDVDQLVKLNDMIHYLEEGKELHIRIEVRTVDNAG